MNRESIDLHEVRPQVERARAENPESAVVLIADRGARTGLLIEVMDQVQAAGISNISISAEPEGGGAEHEHGYSLLCFHHSRHRYHAVGVLLHEFADFVNA